jgi:hypothetical protein
MSHLSVRIILLISLVPLLVLAVSPVHGAESYSLSTSPSQIQESNSPGDTLTLNVANALVQSYSFTFTVTDPTGGTKTASSSISNTQSSFSVSVVYTRDFGGGASITNVGTYSVSVSQTLPPVVSPVASGSFKVGLTDRLTYQRTTAVSIIAQGYGGNEPITVTITQTGSPSPYFQKQQAADNVGMFSLSWPIPASTPRGNYTVSLSGTGTVKTPPDSQTFNITSTQVLIASLTISDIALQRTQSEHLSFTASYPTGIQVQTGTTLIRITETDGTTSHYSTASYNTTSASFMTNYKVPLTGQAGAWVATIDINSFDDGYGNIGPTSSVVKAFTVQKATLSVAVSVANRTYTTGDVVTISTLITNPDGSIFNSGTVVATLSRSGSVIGSPISLFFAQSQSKWLGSFIINSTNPSGIWQIQVATSDAYGNTGQGSTATNVSIVNQTTALQSYWLIIVAAVIGAITTIGVFFLKRKRIFRKQLDIDLRAVGLEAEKITSQDFFKSVKDQLANKKDEKSTDK